MSMKNSNDTIGNRTRDLPACSVNAPPRAPHLIGVMLKNDFYILSLEETIENEVGKCKWQQRWCENLAFNRMRNASQFVLIQIQPVSLNTYPVIL